MVKNAISSSMAVCVICLTLLGSSANAAEADNWQHRLAPLYLWGMSINGDAGFGPVEAPLDVKFEDAVKDMSGVFTIHYEATKGNWTILADYSFVNLEPQAKLPNGASLNVDFKNPLAELGAAYQIGTSPWQVLGGVRYYGLDVEVNAENGANLAKIKEDIYDLFVGGRVITKMSPKWTFIGRADVGTGDSDFVANAGLFFDWRFGKVMSAVAGYRWLKYDIEKGSGADRFKYDVTQQGPLLALAFSW